MSVEWQSSRNVLIIEVQFVDCLKIPVITRTMHPSVGLVMNDKDYVVLHAVLRLAVHGAKAPLSHTPWSTGD